MELPQVQLKTNKMSASVNSQNIKTESLAQFEHCKTWIRRRQKIKSKPRKSFLRMKFTDMYIHLYMYMYEI